MHQILFPNTRIKRVRESLRHPDQAALAARLPIVGERVPARAIWRRRPIRVGRVARHGAAAMRDTAAQGMALAADGASALRDEWRHGRGRKARRATSAAASEAQHVAHVAAPKVAHGAKAATKQAAHVTTASAHAVAHRASALGHEAANAASATAHGAAHGTEAVARSARSATRTSLPKLLLVFAAGALCMFFFDQAQGKRRRALVRDKAAHLRRVATRDVPRTLERRGRFIRGRARGLQHSAPFAHNGRRVHVDDDTLVARVRSEALRHTSVKAGEVHVDAYEGCVTLRGQIESDADIRRICDFTRRIEGVREVRSYLHTPDMPPPNKVMASDEEAVRVSTPIFSNGGGPGPD